MHNRVKSFIGGGIPALALLVVGIFAAVSSSNLENFVSYGILAVMAFTLISCLILKNNFVGEMISDIFDWGFVRMPGVIFTLDLDGIICLLAVKLLFWILGLILAIACGALAIVLGLIVSVFVYPFALYKSFKYPNEI